VNVAVLGAGAWGTALAMVLQRNSHRVTVWAREPDVLADLRRTRRNERYLPGVELPEELTYEADLKRAANGQDAVVMAVASRGFRETAMQLRDVKSVFVSVTKGIEFDTGKTMCGILRECVPGSRVVAMSGPTFAVEVARGMPTAIVAAGEDQEAAESVQTMFHQPRFRVYRSTDCTGVELGGALKNIIAIAAGVCDGLGFGDNSKAALITRGIAEVRRLGVACGAQAETFSGLSGLGDLVATNRDFGERAGRGEKIESLALPGAKLAEGVPTCRAAHQLAGQLQIETPIIDEVQAMLFEGKDVRRGVHDLLNRDIKMED
jgi:glycerol-3-phosphate dehydrogenase (NAD(P)+)